MLTTTLMTLGLFAICFIGMSIGFIIRGTVLSGSCGGASKVTGEESCGACSKKAADMCPSDDDTGLLEIGQMGNPQRTLKERHQEPGMSV